ncbi:MAG: sigma-70 family RNA polymerase sigma factor [Clostridia bacterium]|nr:sigma-70 family RNA polymerase sigma factor [Clostridia bacterium]
MIQLEQLQEVKKLLTKINISYADILTLKYYYSYSNSEIAELMNITEVNVRVKIHRAKQALSKGRCFK